MAWVAGIAASMFVIGIGTILWLAGRINARADDISDFWRRGFLLWKYGGLLLVAMGVGQLVFSCGAGDNGRDSGNVEVLTAS